MVLSLLITLIMISLIKRKPIVIALSDQGEIMKQGPLPSLENDARNFAQAYLRARYSWEAARQADMFTQAKHYIAPQSQKAFEKTMHDLLVFSQGKGVSQRVYPLTLKVDLDAGRIDITADRFTEIQGLRAATTLRVGLLFEVGSRTAENPWGIYVVKEEEK